MRCAWRFSADSRATLTKKRICVYAGSHGVASEGVSAYPSEVTGRWFLNSWAEAPRFNVLARHGGIGIHIIDAGVDPIGRKAS